MRAIVKEEQFEDALPAFEAAKPIFTVDEDVHDILSPATPVKEDDQQSACFFA